VIRWGITAVGCAARTFFGGPGVGTAVGCGIGAGLADLALAGLRGEFGCGQNDRIFGRALLAAGFGALAGYLAPPLPGNYLPQTFYESGPRALLGLNGAVDEFFGGLLAQGMGFLQTQVVSTTITRCNPDAAEYDNRFGPSMMFYERADYSRGSDLSLFVQRPSNRPVMAVLHCGGVSGW
jgi:hypothetical protein